MIPVSKKIDKVDFDGKKYREGAELQQRLGNAILGDLNFQGNERVLDLGCGDGSLTASIADSVPEGFVIGIDSSEGMLNTANEIKRDNLEFKLMDINNFNFNNKFDIIFSNAALHWVHDHGKVLENSYKALKSGAYLRFNFAAYGNCKNLNSVLREVIEMIDFKGYFTDFRWPWYMPTIEEYQELLERYSYVNTELWSQKADKFFSTKDMLTTWIEQPCIVPFLKKIDDEKVRTRFRDIVIDKMIARTEKNDGSYFEQFRRINVLAYKK